MIPCVVNSRPHVSRPCQGASRDLSSLSHSARITLMQIQLACIPFRSNTSASVASKELKTLWNQQFQNNPGGVPITVNQVLETSHPPSSCVPRLLSHSPYTFSSSVSATPLFAILTKTAGGVYQQFPFWNSLRLNYFDGSGSLGDCCNCQWLCGKLTGFCGGEE